jgi:plastocyanin
VTSGRVARQLVLGGALSMIAAAAIAACAGGSAYAPNSLLATPSPSPAASPSPTMSPSPSPSPSGGGTSCIVAIAPAAVETIGVNLTNPNQAACVDSTYQDVKAYFGGSTVTTSQVISVTHSSTNSIQFTNLDFQPHTAASLGVWSGSYPSNGPNPAATPSPKGTDISAPGFTTGNLDPGKNSKKYAANVPGFYIIGCAYHYNSDNMRTVIIVN